MNWPADYAQAECPDCRGTGINESEIVGEIGVAWFKNGQRVCDCVPAITLVDDD